MQPIGAAGKAGTPADRQTKWIGHSLLKTGDWYNHANEESNIGSESPAITRSRPSRSIRGALRPDTWCCSYGYGFQLRKNRNQSMYSGVMRVAEYGRGLFLQSKSLTNAG